MIKKICIVFIMAVMCFDAVFAQSVNAPGNAEIVDYTLNYDGVEINSSLRHPLISYEDTTYMAVRDVAELWNSFIDWDEESQTIDIDSIYSDIDGYTTALAMGKAIVNKYYHDRVTENTEYYLGYLYSGCHPEYWLLCVVFDGESVKGDIRAIIDNADVNVGIESETFDYYMIQCKPYRKVIIDNGPIK